MKDFNDEPMRLWIKSNELKFKAFLFLFHSGETPYVKLLDQLKNGSHLGRGEFPLTVSIMYYLLVIHSGRINHNSRHKVGQMRVTSLTNVIFAHRGVSNENYGRAKSNHVPGAYGTNIYKLCYYCNKHGQFTFNCPHMYRHRQNQGSGCYVFVLVQVTIQLNQSNKYFKVINKHWILVGTCSTAIASNNIGVM